MKKIIVCSIACLLLTGCAEGGTYIEGYTPAAPATPCPESLFFELPLFSRPEQCHRCPDIPTHSEAVQQRFEHGTAIWIEEQNITYVLFDTHQKAGAFGDGDAEEFQLEIASVLNEKPDVRQRLGQAKDQGSTFEAIAQKVPDCGRHFSIYLHANDGSVLRVFDAYDGLYWAKVRTKSGD